VSTADSRGGRRRARFALLPVVGVVALGGMIGSLLRYQAGLIWPTPMGAFPTTILLVNLLGCLIIRLGQSARAIEYPLRHRDRCHARGVAWRAVHSPTGRRASRVNLSREPWRPS
jgi:hypothetical protein